MFPFSREEQKSHPKASQKKVTFDLSEDEESEGEDIEEVLGGKTTNPETVELKSSFEKRQEKVTRKLLVKLSLIKVLFTITEYFRK